MTKITTVPSLAVALFSTLTSCKPQPATGDVEQTGAACAAGQTLMRNGTCVNLTAPLQRFSCSLSSEQIAYSASARGAVTRTPSEAALLGYVLAWYRCVNAGLRSPAAALPSQGVNTCHEYLAQNFDEAVQCIAQALHDRRPHGEVTYRGAALRKDFVEKTYKVGSIFQEGGFVSSSKIREFAENWARGTAMDEESRIKIVYVIQGKNGRDISDVNPDEAEVIFLPGTRFEVLTSETKGDLLVLDVKEI